MDKDLGNDGQMESQAPHVHLQDVHTARGRGHYLKKGSDLPPAGGDDGIESKYIRCKFCGFVIDVTRRGPGTGYSNSNPYMVYPQRLTMVLS